MSFAEFFAAIEHPDLKNVARHWAEARGRNRMPAWADLDPSEIKRQLRLIWAWTYNHRTTEFIGRLAGEDIEAVFGKSFRGAKATDIFVPDRYPAIYERHRRIVLGPCLCRGTGRVFHHLGRLGFGERIIMPLASDRTAGDGLIGATVYKSIEKGEAPAPWGATPPGETVAYYEVDVPEDVERAAEPRSGAA